MNSYSKIKFSSLFDKNDVICHTENTSRNDVLMEMLKLLAYEKGIGNVEQAYELVIEREELLESVVAPGIAMPHARLEALKSPVVAVATSSKGIDFGGSSITPIKLVILILAPKSDPALYLQVTSSLAKICREDDTATRVAELGSQDEVWRFFEREGMSLPDYVCAGDVMDPFFVALKETDNLAHAIDMFVKNNLADLPVLDNDGDLVGVVSAHELFKVCLPDYILWMEDLSPIINFEPFAEILRKESQTWLNEIMSFEYATVPETAPAVEVAKEITKHTASNVYVTRGKKLVGIITLQNFINKILWQ